MSATSLIMLLRSWRYGFWFGVSRRLRWSRGMRRERPAGELQLAAEDAKRVAMLRERYQVQFERTLNLRSSNLNYEYLDILDHAWAYFGRQPPSGGLVCDVGCGSFSYAAAMHAFFQPQRLMGVEIEGHRLLRDGRARIDYAAGYVADIPNTAFVVADYLGLKQPADTITAWFPFVTSGAILAWRLPLSLLEPARLFSNIRHNLTPDGLYIMVNHGPEEARRATKCCVAIGLKPLGSVDYAGPLSRYRAVPPVISLWRRGL